MHGLTLPIPNTGLHDRSSCRPSAPLQAPRHLPRRQARTSRAHMARGKRSPGARAMPPNQSLPIFLSCLPKSRKSAPLPTERQSFRHVHTAVQQEEKGRRVAEETANSSHYECLQTMSHPKCSNKFFGGNIRYRRRRASSSHYNVSSVKSVEELRLYLSQAGCQGRCFLSSG